MKVITLEKHKSMIYFICDLDTLIDAIDLHLLHHNTTKMLLICPQLDAPSGRYPDLSTRIRLKPWILLKGSIGIAIGSMGGCIIGP